MRRLQNYPIRALCIARLQLDFATTNPQRSVIVMLGFAELPSAKGIGNARALVRMFASMIGPVEGFRSLSEEAMNQTRREQWRGRDVVM